MASLPKTQKPPRGNGPDPKPSPLRFTPHEPYWPKAAADGRRPSAEPEGSPWDAVTYAAQIRTLLDGYFGGVWGGGYSTERDDRYQDLRSRLMMLVNGPPFDSFSAATSILVTPTPKPAEIIGTVAYVDAILPPALGFLAPQIDDSWWHNLGRQRLDLLCSWLLMALKEAAVPRPERPDPEQSAGSASGADRGRTRDNPRPDGNAPPHDGDNAGASSSENNPSDRTAQTTATKRVARNREIARRLHANGAPNTKIAERMRVSVRTVHNYLKDSNT